MAAFPPAQQPPPPPPSKHMIPRHDRHPVCVGAPRGPAAPPPPPPHHHLCTLGQLRPPKPSPVFRQNPQTTPFVRWTAKRAVCHGVASLKNRLSPASAAGADFHRHKARHKNKTHRPCYWKCCSVTHPTPPTPHPNPRPFLPLSHRCRLDKCPGSCRPGACRSPQRAAVRGPRALGSRRMRPHAAPRPAMVSPNRTTPCRSPRPQRSCMRPQAPRMGGRLRALHRPRPTAHTRRGKGSSRPQANHCPCTRSPPTGQAWGSHRLRARPRARCSRPRPGLGGPGCTHHSGLPVMT